jgi:hypothetical protein
MKPPRLFVVAVVVILSFSVLVIAYDPWPARDAIEGAKQQAIARGYSVESGGVAEFVVEPDALGACEVDVRLGSAEASLVVRVRRTWRFGEWKLVSFAPHG